MKKDAKGKKLETEAGYRLEVSEYVRAATVMIKLLHEGHQLNADETKMLKNAHELFTAVFTEWQRKEMEES